MAKAQQKSEVLVLVGGKSGVVVVPQPTVLTRLHYFDGKLLRADDLSKEQAYLRSLVHLSNQAGGFGVVHGLDIALSPTGNALLVGPGMAIDPNGRVLLLPVSSTQLGIDDLIAKSQDWTPPSGLNGGGGGSASAASFVNCLPAAAAEPAPDHTPQDTSLYLITVGFAEALCGQDDVFGKLCEEACAGSTDRPFTIEGLVFRAVPLLLKTPLATSTMVTLGPVHRRSLVASAYFADEKAALPHLISGAGLRSRSWCKGALLFCGNEVPLGVLSRSGSQTQFLDAWTARRERIEDAPRRYWAMRMAMRPWNILLAQVLQFQCQLAELLKGHNGPGTPEDPCVNALSAAAGLLASLKDAVGDAGGDAGAAAILALESFLSQAKTDITTLPGERMLIEGGIVELPPAGYLPVSPTALATVNDQVRRLCGEGLDLRFCVVRHDFVQHALEEAQHMDRISLLHGLEHPDEKPEVDILVPDGEILSLASSKDLFLFRTTVELNDAIYQDPSRGGDEGDAQPPAMIKVEGAGRIEPLPGRGAAFHAAGITTLPAGAGHGASTPGILLPRSILSDAAGPSGPGPTSAWVSLRSESNPFTSNVGDVVPISGTAVEAVTGATARLNMGGNVRVLAASHPSSTEWSLSARLELFLSSETTSSNGTQKNSRQVVILVNATFKGAVDGAELTAALSSPDPDDGAVTCKVTWGGTPLTAQIKLTASTTDQAGVPVLLEMFKVKLVHDADILDASNAWHGVALQAASAIGVALNDGLFADTAERLLFPSPGLSGAELVVRAARDWVLFHRRRNKRCSVDRVRPALPPRRYQLFVVDAADLHVANTPTAQEIYEVFLQNDVEKIDLLRQHAQPLTVVEYSGGKATLLTQEATLKSAWQASVPQGMSIALGLIATKGADDTSILEVARVDRFEQVVSSITTLASGAVSLSVSDVPPEFDTPATDGFILCYIVQHAALECQSAFVMELPDWNAMSFDSIIYANEAFFENLGINDQAPVASTALGSVHFDPNSSSVAGGGASVQSNYFNWLAGMPYTVEPAFCDAFTTAGGIDIDDFPHRQRARSIAEIIQPGVALVPSGAAPSSVPSLATCPVSTILAVRPVFVNVVTIDLNMSLQTALGHISSNEFPGSSGGPFQTAERIRLQANTPLSSDVDGVVAALDLPPSGAQLYEILVLTTFAEPNDGMRLTSLASALTAAGVMSASFSPMESFIRGGEPWLSFKEPGAKHVLILFRTMVA